jgi:cold shock CspA family protein
MAGQVLTGTIDKWMGPDSSYSFIAFDGDAGERVFVHQSAIKGDKPAKGDKVQFKIIAETRKGVLRECAANVSLVKGKPVANAAAVQTEEDGGDDDYDVDEHDDDGIPPAHYRAVVT